MGGPQGPYYCAVGAGNVYGRDIGERIQHGVDLGKKSGFIKSGQPIVCITGWRQGSGSSNTVRIVTVDETKLPNEGGNVPSPNKRKRSTSPSKKPTQAISPSSKTRKTN